MGLGKRKDDGSFLPIAKYDARAGRISLQDRVHTNDGWQTKQRDITDKFKAAIDLENLQRGWLLFPKGAAPQVTLVPAGEDPGDAPSDDHREGFRALLVMAPELGGDIRELMSTARGLWDAVDALHDEYLVSVAGHPGELPVVVIESVHEEKRGAGTTFVPKFAIVDWTPRPPELAQVLQARAIKAQRTLPLGKPKAVAKRMTDDIDAPIPF